MHRPQWMRATRVHQLVRPVKNNSRNNPHKRWRGACRVRDRQAFIYVHHDTVETLPILWHMEKPFLDAPSCKWPQPHRQFCIFHWLGRPMLPQSLVGSLSGSQYRQYFPLWWWAWLRLILASENSLYSNYCTVRVLPYR